MVKPAGSQLKNLVINDIHFPFECKPALELALDVGQDLKPDIVTVNGDLLDMWQVSRFVQNPALHDKANLRRELEIGKKFLHRLRKLFPASKIVYIFGNHEYRWQTFIAKNASELFGLKGLSLEEQLECSDLGIKVVNSGQKENSWLWGKLLIGHFDKVCKHSGATAKNLLEDKCISLLQAHVHRGGACYRRFYDRDLVAYENFCLCDRSPEYVDRPNWQLGFSIVYKDRNSDFFYVEQKPIVEITGENKRVYKCFFNGKLYQREGRV